MLKFCQYFDFSLKYITLTFHFKTSSVVATRRFLTDLKSIFFQILFLKGLIFNISLKKPSEFA